MNVKHRNKKCGETLADNPLAGDKNHPVLY